MSNSGARTFKDLVRPLWRQFANLLPSRWHVMLDHYRIHGHFPNLDQPVTFNEKIASAKLHNRDPRLPLMVDKIAVKEQMRSRFGDDFIIPTLAVFDTEKDLDFRSLPYPCVIKANHASGTNLFLAEPPSDERKSRRDLRRLLRWRHHPISEEWAYSMVRPRLLIEPWIHGGEHGLVDYKFHTFSGRVYAVQVDVDRFTDHRRAIFDPEWHLLPIDYLYQQPSFPIAPPVHLHQMLRYAEQIGDGFPYVRVDLYEIEGQVKFGETTFYPEAGLGRFRPQEYDAIFGAQWVLQKQQ